MILLDMDGVLVDFHTGFAKEHSVDPEKAIPGYWNFIDAYPELKLLSDKDLYGPLEHDFWSGLQWMHDGKEILTLLEDHFKRENIVICTAPTFNKGCIPGKLEWIYKNMNKYYHKPSSYMITGAKHVAAKGNILIDDHNKNIDLFRIKGGIGILIPRLWNDAHTYRHNVISDLQDEIKSLSLTEGSQL